jgi:hypothetical protein
VQQQQSAAPVLQQQEHRSIKDEIDYTFLECVVLSQRIDNYFIKKMGAPEGVFMPFYDAFGRLYRITSALKAMEPYEETRNRIQSWRVPGGDITDNRLKAGVQLFDEWASGLFKSGLLSLGK